MFTQKGEDVKKDAKLLTNNIDFAGIEGLRGKEIKKNQNYVGVIYGSPLRGNYPVAIF